MARRTSDTNDTTSTPTEHVAVRLASSIVRELDEFASVWTTEWMDVTRSDVLRAAISEGMGVLRAKELKRRSEKPTRTTRLPKG